MTSRHSARKTRLAKHDTVHAAADNPEPLRAPLDPWMIALVGCGLILHLIWLGRASLWIDEIVTIRDAISQQTVTQIYATELQRFHWYRCLPLFMVPIHFVGKFFPGPSFPPEWALRLPGAVFAALTLPFFYGLGNVVGGRRLARATLALAVFSPFHLYYSREAYSYSYLMAFSAGMLWGSLLLLAHDWRQGTPWKACFCFVPCATLMLQTHLTGLMFLSVWLVVMAFVFIQQRGLRAVFAPRLLGTLMACVLVPYLCFSPFLIRLLTVGYSSTDTPGVTSFSFGALRAIFGRMGWGEAWWSLIPFLAALVAGAVATARRPDRRWSPSVAALLIQLFAYIAIQGTYQCLTASRFEIRYFSSAFPILMVFAASGLVHLWRSRSDGPGDQPWFPATSPAIAGALTAVLAAWLLVADGLVIAVRCRGHNYRAMAQWINDRLPEGGIYAYDNIWDIRGVPGVYPTPGRTATAVAAWTSLMDVKEVRLPERVNSLFARFPGITFVEVAPADLLDPRRSSPPIDRDVLFMRQEWLSDTPTDWLFALGLHPLGDVLWFNRALHRALFSYNLPEDLSALAVKRGQSTYHSIGRGWNYVNDEGYNHWMVTTGEAEVYAGNATSEPLQANLGFTFLPQPPGCRIQVTSPTGQLVANHELPAKSEGNSLVTFWADNQLLPPGTTRYVVNVDRLEAGSPVPPAVLRSFEVQPSARTAATQALPGKAITPNDSDSMPPSAGGR